MGHPNMGAPKGMGHPNMVGVQTYGGHPKVWASKCIGASECMGASKHMGGHDVSKHIGASNGMCASKCMGGMQMYRGVQKYGASKHRGMGLPNVWGHGQWGVRKGRPSSLLISFQLSTADDQWG